MAGGTHSITETTPPQNSVQWKAALSQLYADTVNRKREEKEVRTAVKVATVVCDIVHAETRRALAEKAIGKRVEAFKTA